MSFFDLLVIYLNYMKLYLVKYDKKHDMIFYVRKQVFYFTELQLNNL